MSLSLQKTPQHFTLLLLHFEFDQRPIIQAASQSHTHAASVLLLESAANLAGPIRMRTCIVKICCFSYFSLALHCTTVPVRTDIMTCVM